MPLTISEFITTLPRPRSVKTVRRWICNGMIYPPPEKFGREYIIADDAVYTGSTGIIPSSNRNNKLLSRVKNGRTEKNS